MPWVDTDTWVADEWPMPQPRRRCAPSRDDELSRQEPLKVSSPNPVDWEHPPQLPTRRLKRTHQEAEWHYPGFVLDVPPEWYVLDSDLPPRTRVRQARQESEWHFPDLLTEEEVHHEIHHQAISPARRLERTEPGDTSGPQEWRLTVPWIPVDGPAPRAKPVTVNVGATHDISDIYATDDPEGLLVWAGEVPAQVAVVRRSREAPFTETVQVELIENPLWSVLADTPVSSPRRLHRPEPVYQPDLGWHAHTIDVGTILPGSWICFEARVRTQEHLRADQMPATVQPPITEGYGGTPELWVFGESTATQRRLSGVVAGRDEAPPWVACSLIVVSGPFSIIDVDLYTSDAVEASTYETG